MNTTPTYPQWLKVTKPIIESLTLRYQTLSQEQQIWFWIVSTTALLLTVSIVSYLIYRTFRLLNDLLQSPTGWRPINVKSAMWVGTGIWLLLLANQTRSENLPGWSVPAACGIVVIVGFIYFMVRKLKILRAIGASVVNTCIGAILAPIVIHSVILIVVFILVCVALWISALFGSRRVVYVEYR